MIAHIFWTTWAGQQIDTYRNIDRALWNDFSSVLRLPIDLCVCVCMNVLIWLLYICMPNIKHQTTTTTIQKQNECVHRLNVARCDLSIDFRNFVEREGYLLVEWVSEWMSTENIWKLLTKKRMVLKNGLLQKKMRFL